jgi:signal transduction histidine kinase
VKTRRQVVTGLYQSALLAFLRHKGSSSPQSMHGLGLQALQAGMKTLEVARLHEDILVTKVLPNHPQRGHAGLIKRAGVFFALAMTPAETGNSGTVIVQLKRSIEQLSRRTVALAGANLALSLEIIQRKSAEQTLKQSERRYSQLLEQSDRLQEQLRSMSRRILSAQEDERKSISRELHDVIAQTLTGINIRLAAIKHGATVDASSLDRSINRTQRLVVKAVGIVHRFARDLRPAVLDDLGLIPALHTFLKPLAKQSGFHARISVCAQVERLDIEKRTVLFRVAQEALTNIARHARASKAEVHISSEQQYMCMRIHDDGHGFNAPRMLQSRGSRHLGLLGMRERLEMFGGTFAVTSSKEHGTEITARIPLIRIGRRPSGRKSPRKEPRP